MMSWSAERRFMVAGVIQHQKGTLVVELPVHGSEQIKVQLAANEKIGEIVLSKLELTDTLLSLNAACQEIGRVCPFGYEEFIDMLEPKPEPRTDRYRFYQEYETTPPSLEGGVKFLMGETKRYHTTMENYACACRAAEDEEYDSPEDAWDQLLFRRKEEI